MKTIIPASVISALLLVFPSLEVSCQDTMNDTQDWGTIPMAISRELPSDLPGGRHIIEVAHGEAFVDRIDPWAWFFSGNYLYRIKQNAAFGAGAGLQFDWTGLYPVISLNTILGDKIKGLAFGGDIKYIFTDLIGPDASRFWITGGIYYKNLFIKVMPTFLFGYPGEWYLESGYSFNIGR
jgi:hypothetical protein